MTGKLVLLHTRKFGDERGWFMETYNKTKFEALGQTYDFVQDNHSMSVQAGTIRGLHFQTPPFAQAKLVRCVRGRIFDVAVDLRKGAPTYGQWLGVELSADNADQFLIPEGFAHGFVTLEPNTEVVYKVSSTYAPANDGGLAWNDPDIAIDWPIPSDMVPTLSDKDKKQPGLAAFDTCFLYDGEPMELLEV